MPLRYRKLIQGNAIFFLTTSTFNRKPFPNFPDCLNTIEEILFRTAKDKSIFIMGFVLMPNHVHIIAGSNDGGNGISKFMHSFKGRVRETLVGKGKFWQDRFDDLLLTTEKQFRVKLNYVHYNPVKAELVSRPDDWIYSSYLDWEKGASSKAIMFDFNWLI